MDEFQHFERLDTGQEFEGGEWIDGEFFHRGKKKGKVQQTQEDRLYGVFQGSSDEEGGKGGRKRKRRDGDDTAVLHKPVGFVSTGVITDVMDDHEETDKLHGPQQRPREPEGTAAVPLLFRLLSCLASVATKRAKQLLNLATLTGTPHQHLQSSQAQR